MQLYNTALVPSALDGRDRKRRIGTQNGRSTLKLNHPPIVEALIELDVEPTDTESTWPSEATKFLEDIQGELPELEGRIAQRLEFVNVDTTTGVPEKVKGEQVLERVRAFDKERSRCVQGGANSFVFNLTRKGADYPGFEALLDGALRYYAYYAARFRPKYVRKAVLRYLDLITLPVTGKRGIQLDDYFNFGVKVPDDKQWAFNGFAAHVSVSLRARTGENDHLVLRLENRPFDARDGKAQILLSWHWVADGVKTAEIRVIETRLRKLHDEASTFFRSAVTNKLWETFGPDKGE